MGTKKEQERDELHRAIWAIADDLRGSVDGWDFKSYVLGFMFYRYISENLTNYINKGEHAAGNTEVNKVYDEAVAWLMQGFLPAFVRAFANISELLPFYAEGCAERLFFCQHFEIMGIKSLYNGR